MFQFGTLSKAGSTFFQARLLGGDDITPSLQVQCLLPTTWAWISSINLLGVFFFVKVLQALIILSHLSYFEARSVSIQISFGQHTARLERCCCLTYFSTFLLFVFFFYLLEGERLGIRRLEFGYQSFLLVIKRSFKWKNCCTHKP